jgi:hypothetical protein
MDVDSDSISDPFDNDGTPISKLDPHFRLTQLKVPPWPFHKCRVCMYGRFKTDHILVTGSREATS